MQYGFLGKNKIKVSKICLGTMTWGEQNSVAEAFEQMDYALDQGVNFFDTAEMYPVPPRAETCHRTEEYIGQWFKERKNRTEVVLASKVVGPGAFVKHVRDGNTHLSRKNLFAALDASLKRLGTDYIDLYQIHWPDRPTNFFGQLGYKYSEKNDFIPIEETLFALDELVKEGKVREIGVSNETPWGVSEYLKLSREKGLARIASIQNPYSLLNRSFEVGLAEFAHREDLPLLAYSPLAFGVLSGKYLNGAKPEGARCTLWSRFDRYFNQRGEEATAAYVQLASDFGLDPAQMALAFVNQRSFVLSNIIGATTMTQLESNLSSMNLELPKEVIKSLESLHLLYPNPCP